MQKNSLVHFELPVNDPEKMTRFYSEAFGWSFEASPMGEGQTYWRISTGPEGQSLGGGMYKKQGPDELVRFYVSDPDLEGAISRFQNAGGSLINRFDIPGTVTGALLYDPEKNVVGIIKGSSSSAASSRGGSRRKKRGSSTKTRSKASARKKSSSKRRKS